MIHKLSDFSTVFLSYDEPNAEKNWSWLKQHVPTAQRVHGIKGFDAAHIKCGELSKTDRVITIDGDNWIDPGFFNSTIEITDNLKDSVISWPGKNSVNGQSYGNGGIKLWPVHIIKNMKSHENAEGDTSKIDFCWHISYWQIADVFCDTVINETPYQAFRAGFREGVKMSLDYGNKIARREFENLSPHNRQRLAIWCSVGNDVENGDWAIFGARLGCVKTMLEDWTTDLVADYDWFDGYWSEIFEQYVDDVHRKNYTVYLGERLRNDLRFNVSDLDEHQSRFFKSVWNNPERNGLMV